MPVGQGLFGGGVPYPVDPAMQRGLMQDAWRQFGLQLLANAQNPNITQGLAAAMGAGRQAYAGGAERAYEVGREQAKDKQYQDYIQSQIQGQKALAEQRRQDSQAAARKAESAATNRAEALAAIDDLPVSDQQKAAMRFRVQFGMGEPTESMLLPEEEASLTPYQEASLGLQRERLDLQRQQAGEPDGDDDGLSAARLSTRIGQLIDGLTKQYQGSLDMGEINAMPPYHVIRAQAEQRLAQEVAAVGRAGGAQGQPSATAGATQPTGMDLNQTLEQVLSAAPEATREALRAEAERRMQSEDPATVLAELARALGVL